ncbi:MAG: molecular chaperone TorD family protein [Alphaproteobacteria bacterium]|nr:molecular chaperone TorD family protein [Alphaproteobacteria bacterium]
MIAPEDQIRAQVYQLIAAPLSAPPSGDLLSAFAGISGDDSALGKAMKQCATAAAAATPDAEDDAYHELFIGIGAGVLVPFGSYYLTGFLHEKPLAKLRADMAELGVEKDPDVKEPEDHIASVLELMSGLIEGRFGAPVGLDRQQAFFKTHVGSWAGHFFEDLSKTQQSAFYAAVGTLGVRFIEIENESFEYA